MSVKFITLVGNVGSGKSTALPLLVDELQALPLLADDLFQTSDPFSQQYLEDLPRWAFTNELWLTNQRARLQRAHMAAQENSQQVTLVDSGLLMSWVYTYSHWLVGNITEPEWQLYQDLYDSLASDLLGETGVVRLQYSLPTLLKRIQKRGRDYELQFYTQAYLEQIESGLDALEQKLTAQGVPFLRVSETEVADFEANPIDAQTLQAKVKTLVE